MTIKKILLLLIVFSIICFATGCSKNIDEQNIKQNVESNKTIKQTETKPEDSKNADLPHVDKDSTTKSIIKFSESEFKTADLEKYDNEKWYDLFIDCKPIILKESGYPIIKIVGKDNEHCYSEELDVYTQGTPYESWAKCKYDIDTIKKVKAGMNIDFDQEDYCVKEDIKFDLAKWDKNFTPSKICIWDQCAFYSASKCVVKEFELYSISIKSFGEVDGKCRFIIDVPEATYTYDEINKVWEYVHLKHECLMPKDAPIDDFANFFYDEYEAVNKSHKAYQNGINDAYSESNPIVKYCTSRIV
jgi:hypothetical protein